MESNFDSEEFVKVVHRDVLRAAVGDVISVLESPPGRNPSVSDRERSQWYLQLSDADREMVHQVVQEAAQAGVFGLLCLLDNVRPVVDGFAKTMLVAIEGGGETTVLNGAGDLHEIFTSKTSRDRG